MSYNIITGIADVDAKGKTGRGTVYWMEIRQGEVVIERHTWGLMDELEGRFYRQAIKNPYLQANQQAYNAAKETKAEEKKQDMARREAEVKEDPALSQIINEALDANLQAVVKFRSGKEKALNAIVGKVIGQAKKAGIDANAFAVNHMLRQRLAS